MHGRYVKNYEKPKKLEPIKMKESKQQRFIKGSMKGVTCIFSTKCMCGVVRLEYY